MLRKWHYGDFVADAQLTTQTVRLCEAIVLTLVLGQGCGACPRFHLDSECAAGMACLFALGLPKTSEHHHWGYIPEDGVPAVPALVVDVMEV